MHKSVLQIERTKYSPKMPKALAGAVKVVEGRKTDSVADQKEIKKRQRRKRNSIPSNGYTSG